MKITTQQHPWNVYEGITWSAWDDDSYDGAPDAHSPIGNGSTEREAINDLVEQIVEDLETRLDRWIKLEWTRRKELTDLRHPEFK